MVKSNVSQSTVTLTVTGLEGSDKASVVFSDGAGKYSYVNYSNLANGSVTYKIENNLNLGTTITASGSSSYAVNPITDTGLVTSNKTISAAFQKQVAPVVKKINATYWAMWGSNTSYDVGGTYPSVAVDAPNIDSSYNVIIASFIITDSSGNYILSTYDPGSTNPVKYYTDDQIINFVKQVKAQGRKIIVSLGGEKFHLTMKTDADVATFATQVDKIIDKYGFEGIDLDLEGGATAEDPVLLAKAVMQVVNNYRGKGQDFWLTMAPEWVYVIPYGYGCGQWGSHSYHNTFYAKLVNSLGINNINYIWPQTYNQGPANGICGSSENEVKPGSGMDKFVAALTWAATTESGFAVNTRGMTGDIMPIIPANKFVIGIPATLGAAGGYMAYVMTPALISSSWQVMKNTYGISAGGFMNWAAD
jgi:chitinase